MGLISWFEKRMLTKLEQNIVKTYGSEFYKALLRNVQNMPVYMKADIEAFINEGYLFNPTVYSIVSFIAQKAASIPWGVYEVKNEKALSLYKTASYDLPQFKREMIKTKALVELPDHDINALLKDPNELQDWPEFIEQVVGFKLVTGNTYIHCIGPTAGPNKGHVREMWTLPSPAVVIVAGDHVHPVRQYELKGERDIVIKPENMIHLKYWTPEYVNGRFLYGLSPIQAARRVVTKSNSSFDSMVASFQNMGAVGVMSPKNGVESLTEEQQEDMERTWDRKTGPKRRGKPIFTGTPVDWQQIGMSPVDLSIIESDKMDLRTLCSIYHLSSELFNDSANKTHTNMKEAGSSAYTNAVIPHLIQLRGAINKKMNTRYDNVYIDFDTSMISELQEDLTEMTAALSGAWWLTLNERRDMMSFGMDDQTPFANDYFIPAGLSPLSAYSDISDVALEEAAKQLGINDYK